MANYLLLETGDRLLLETGDRLLLEDQASAGITGSAGVVLAGVTSAAAGMLVVKGTGAMAIGAVGGVATGAVAIKAVGSVNLGPVTMIGSGGLVVKGSIATTLAALSLTAAGNQGATGAAVITLTDTALAATTTVGPVTAPAPTPTHYGGGWSAHEFARLRSKLARKKKRLRQAADEILAALPGQAPPGDSVDALAALAPRIEAAIAQLHAATTMSALREIQGRLHAVRATIEAEIDDEEILLLAA